MQTVTVIRRQRVPSSAEGGYTAITSKVELPDGRILYALEREDVIIPAGEYPLTITYSPRFKRRLPLINNVPGRSGIRIHAGNYARESEGCLLMGLDIVKDNGSMDARTVASRVALTRLITGIDWHDDVRIVIYDLP